MTLCNRCGTEFENYFNGMHWCPSCGKQFLLDENLLKTSNEPKSKL